MRLVAAELAGNAKEDLPRLRTAGLKFDFALAGIGFDIVELFEEIDVPRHAAVFAVGDRLQSGRFLLGDGAGDFAVFDLVKSLGCDLPEGALLARGLERSAAQQAADMIGAKRWGGALHSLPSVSS